LLVWWILSTFSLSQTLPTDSRNSAQDVHSAESVRATLGPWLRAVEVLMTKTNDEEVRSYLRVLHNAAMMYPTGEGGDAVLAQRVLAPPPDTTHPWIGVVIITPHESLPAGKWQQLASSADFAAEYHEDVNTIVLRSDIPQIAVIRGLLLVHEMRHWQQARPPGTLTSPESRLRKEIDAYETEFRILDALRLPHYQELFTAERLRVRQGPLQPDFKNPLLTQVFGTFPTTFAKQMAAIEITVRAAFAELNTLPPQRAEQGKMDLLRHLGYQ